MQMHHQASAAPFEKPRTPATSVWVWAALVVALIAMGGSLAHRRDDPVGLLDDPGVRGEHLIGEGHLRWVDRPLALVAEHRGALRRGDKSIRVRKIAERTVDRTQAVGAAGDHHARLGRMPTDDG